MPTIRIAVASTPLTATLAEAVPAAIAAVEEAGRLGARIVCLPETAVPGHRLQPRDVPDVTQDELDRALDEIAVAVRRTGVVTIVGTERPTPAGREIVSVVLDADGGRLGDQVKTQIDPTEEPAYVAGSGRRTFTAGGPDVRHRDLPRGLSLPGDQPRARARRRTGGVRAALGDHRGRPAADALDRRVQPVQREGPDVPRAREHGLRRAVQQRRPRGSATCIVAPDGSLVAQVPYGEVGVAAADIDLSLADARLARRWSPERNRQTSGISA